MNKSDVLLDMYYAWLEQENLPELTADDLLEDDDISDDHKVFLHTFWNMWTSAVDAE